MDKARIIGILILVGYFTFVFRDDVMSWLPVPGGPTISEAAKQLAKEISPYVNRDNKQDVANLGNLFIHESNLFTQSDKYTEDRDLKDKFNETLRTSAGYSYGMNISQYPNLQKVLINNAVLSIGEEGFSKETVSAEFKKMGDALKYAAR